MCEAVKRKGAFHQEEERVWQAANQTKESVVWFEHEASREEARVKKGEALRDCMTLAGHARYSPDSSTRTAGEEHPYSP